VVRGAYTTLRGGYPPKPDVTIILDADMVSFWASSWWRAEIRWLFRPKVRWAEVPEIKSEAGGTLAA
jgi:hypothetical protein